MFKAATDGNVTRLEMSPDVLDMAVKIANYIDNDFIASDFLTLGNARQKDLHRLLDILKAEQAANHINGDGGIIFSLDDISYQTLERVLMYGRSFGDDIPELQQYYDEIWDIAEVISPTAN